jgi:hypothetical protein
MWLHILVLIFYPLFMECKCIYIRQGHYLLIGLNERLYRFEMKNFSISFLPEYFHVKFFSGKSGIAI